MTRENKASEDEELARRTYEAWRCFDRAFDALSMCYRERILSYCTRLLGKKDDGEDATQIALQRALKSFATLDRPEAFKGWLYQIARNCCIDLVKKRDKMVTNVQGEPYDPFVHLPDPVDAITEIHEASAAKEAICAAKAAIAGHDELDRSIFDLLYITGIKNIAEISRRIGKPENTIRGRVENIRRKMADIGRHINEAE